MHSCGLFAVIDHSNAAHLVRMGLHALQHRGEESAAICSLVDGDIIRHGGMGLVSDAITPGDLPKTRTAIGHVRYSTTGQSTLKNMQPMFNSEGDMVLAHNGNITNAEKLRQQFDNLKTSTDTEVILKLIETADTPIQSLQLINQLEGAYCLLLMDKNIIMAIRDPLGFRPLVLGSMDGATIIASETCALSAIGADFVRDITPGEAFVASIDNQNKQIFYFGSSTNKAQCIFEHIYFADPASDIFGENVHTIRYKMGQELARESPVEADVIAPVPHSGLDAGLGYSSITGIAYSRAFTTNNYSGRSFIMPEQASRQQKVAAKLHIIKDNVRDKSICLVEDSIVRGTTMQTMVKILRRAGARKVHLRVASPPILHPCYFGIDFPDPMQLIANGRDIPEIQLALKVDSLKYLSIGGMLKCVNNKDAFCTACFTGKYPVHVDTQLRKERFD